jgi:FKBP-type peptidyl-prolyl cis-trans isomerase (trigger factor)
MKNNLKKLSDTSVELKVTLDAQDVEPIVEKTYAEVASHVKVAGFRKGKVPRQIINQRVGTAYIIEEVTNEAINQFYSKAALEQNIKVMGQPTVDVEQPYDFASPNKGIAFTAKVDVRPEVEIPSVEGRKLSVEVKATSKDDISQRLEFAREQVAQMNASDGEKSVELPALDDEFAKSIGFEKLDDLKKAVESDLEQANLSAAVGSAGDKILEELLSEVTIPLPEKVVEDQVENFLKTQKDQGKKPDAKERDEAKERAERDIRSQILLDTYADQNDIKVAQEEIINYATNMSQQYGIDPNQFLQMMMQQGQLPMLASEVSRSKTLAHMLRRIEVSDQKGKVLDLTPYIGADEEKKEKPARKAPAKKTAKKDTAKDAKEA